MMMSQDDSSDSKNPQEGTSSASLNNSFDERPMFNTQLISSTFPLPPMRYLKLYSDAHVANRSAPPPPKPFTAGQYLMFGQTITIDDTIIRPLESQGLRRLYPREYDHKRELKKMNASILVNFLDLIDLLIRCPDSPKRDEKCNDLQLLFINVSTVIGKHFV